MIFHSVVTLDCISKIVVTFDRVSKIVTIWSSYERRLSNSEFENPQVVFFKRGCRQEAEPR